MFGTYTGIFTTYLTYREENRSLNYFYIEYYSFSLDIRSIDFVYQIMSNCSVGVKCSMNIFNIRDTRSRSKLVFGIIFEDVAHVFVVCLERSSPLLVVRSSLVR